MELAETARVADGSWWDLEERTEPGDAPRRQSESAVTIEIVRLRALEILDSRGWPTPEVHLETPTVRVSASVPSGAPGGGHEAVERRDGDCTRFHGAGVRGVIEAIQHQIEPALRGRSWSSLEELDAVLCNLDGTEAKQRLGANATLGVSMAAARAFAATDGQPLHRSLPHPAPERLPVPYFDVVSGGAHANNRLDFQEFMIVPVGAPDLAAAVRAGAEIYASLRSALVTLGVATGVGDEGGFAPPLQAPEDVLDLLCQAICDAGYVCSGTDQAGMPVAIALDLAAARFRHPDGTYRVNGSRFDAAGFVEYLGHLVDRYPITSLEDAMADDDGKGWVLLTERLGRRVQLVGDAGLATSSTRIAEAAEWGRGNAVLVAPTHVGTVTEVVQAIGCAYDCGFDAMVSHREGETNDSFIADLAVAVGCGQIKAGAPARGERVEKYNRLLEIEAATPDLPYGRRSR